jgi:hypothetical protein
MPEPKNTRWRLKTMNTRLRLRAKAADSLRFARGRALDPLGVTKLRYLAFVPLLILAILLVAWIKMPSLHEARYRPVEEPFLNPMIGWAIPAGDRSGSLETSLVYAELTWRELEPEQDQFDFKGFEERNSLNEWWGTGKRLILRFIIDKPGEPGHMDIPDWLYEMTGGDGAYYETESGGGFSPNYANIMIRDQHRSAISAIGARYGGRSEIAYIEIGSLGHDGMWRLDRDADMFALPPPNVARLYTWHYIRTLGSTLTLMRAPYRDARTMGLGLFSDALGDGDAIWEFLDTVAHGGYDPHIATDLYPMEDFWKRAPSGSHIAKTVDLETMLTGDATSIERQLREGHISYVALETNLSGLTPAALEGMAQLSESMGYRLWIRSARWDARIKRGYRAAVKLEFRNDGAAPLYGEWKPVLALINNGEVAYMEYLRMDTIDLQPGRTGFDLWVDIPAKIERASYTLAFAVLNADTEAPAIRLAMEECGADLWTRLGSIEVI